MTNVAVLGAGFMGQTHARAFARIPGVRVVGVSSRDGEKAARLAAAVGAEPFTDTLALVRHPDVAAVSITLPTHLHAEYAIAALQAGKHVLVEKPLALTLDACTAISAAAAASGDRIVMVAHVLRFWPAYVAIADIIRGGELGQPLLATAVRLCAPPTWGEWFDHPEWSGGAVLDLHIHDLDVFNWLFGAPVSLYTRGRQGAHGGWDAALTVLDYGGIACFAEGNALMPASYPFTMTLRVVCAHGAVEYALQAGGEQVDSAPDGGATLMLYKDGAAPARISVPDGDGYANQSAAFIACVRSGRQPINGTLEQGRQAVATALAARTSLATGQPVHF